MSTVSTIDEPTASDRAGSVWDYISPSRLTKWLSCPRAFKLHYVEGIRSPTTPSLFLGQRVHDGLEVFYRHRQLGIDLEPSDVSQRIVDAWDEAVVTEQMAFDSSTKEDFLRQQTINLVAAYIENMPGDEPKPIVVETSLEVPLVDPFSGEALGIPLLGIVDLVLPDEDGMVIVDHKTAARSGAPHEMMHEIQLTSYAWMFRQMTGQAEAGLEIRKLVKNKTPKIEFHCYPARTDEHFRRLFAVIGAYLEDLDRRRFVYRPGLGCSMCEHCYNHCRVAT